MSYELYFLSVREKLTVHHTHKQLLQLMQNNNLEHNEVVLRLSLSVQFIRT